MSKITKWKNIVFLSFTVVTMGFLAYGIYHTANAFNNIKQSHTITDTLVSSPSSTGDSLDSSGTFCNPYGCAGCGGCVSLQYKQDVEAIPGFTTQIKQVD